MRYGWRPYVSVAQRRHKAARQMAGLRKKGIEILPVEIEGRQIAGTFWGQAWCGHLESFSDFSNRLPRGRTYVRNGSVCHLEIARGTIRAIVSGSELYDVAVTIKRLAPRKWGRVKQRCAGQIGSLLELLQGKLSASVMEVVTDRTDGMFPHPKEISLDCDCPDWAVMCKHVAAVLYGVGARLDEKPELLFLLRGVDHEELISAEAEAAAGSVVRRGGSGRRIADKDLSDVFGIDIAREHPRTVSSAKPGRKKTPMRKTAKKPRATGAAGKTKAGKAGKAGEAEKKATRKKRKTSAKQSPKKAKKRASRKKAVRKTAKKAVTTRAKSVRRAAGKTSRGSE